MPKKIRDLTGQRFSRLVALDKEIAEDLGLAYTTVVNAINGSKWKDVAPMPV